MEKLIIGGKYKHYKGNFYKLLNLGRLEENLEEVVVYQGLYDSEEFGNNPVWIRKKSSFLEEVDFKREKVPRFKYIE
jgi:hypothetical protein